MLPMKLFLKLQTLKMKILLNKLVMFILEDVSLEKVSSTKFLGVNTNENLTRKNHDDAIFKTFLEILKYLIN